MSTDFKRRAREEFIFVSDSTSGQRVEFFERTRPTMSPLVVQNDVAQKARNVFGNRTIDVLRPEHCSFNCHWQSLAARLRTARLSYISSPPKCRA